MIYYVEDDDNIRGLTLYALKQQGIEAEGFSCDSEFKAAVARRVPDAVLLDIMLPDTDGLEIMRRLRADSETATVPIMMLTAKDTELDKVVALDGNEIKLTLREFDLLEYLMRKPGIVFSREALLQSVWGWDFDGGSRTVDVHVQTLRQKLGDHASCIETVRGVGYRFAGHEA